MSKRKSFQLTLSAMIVFSILFPFVGQTSINTDKEKQPDVITIGLGPELSKEEMADVNFRHDLHTKALDDKCSACHNEKDGRLVVTFKRTDQAPSMDFYHAECITCHVEKKAAGNATGPVADQCGACHVLKPLVVPGQKKIEFDKSLHYIHVSSDKIKSKDAGDDQNCSACHHVFDEQKNSFAFKKGEEGSCAYCHRPTPSALESGKVVRDIRLASHQSCVACHQELITKKQAAGPITCAGCHDEKEQAKLEKLDNVPRLKRSQPDYALLTPWEKGTEKQETFMPAVAFDHKFHEDKGQSCKSCHHETLKKCSECHTPDGGEEKGGFVSLAKAMHKPGSSQSCIGCHKEMTTALECAGCHAQMPVTAQKNPESCKACHNVESGQFQNAADLAMVAKDVVADREGTYTRVPADKIPEKVVIDDLVNEYKASEFPHGKVVRAIMEKADQSDLARTFHKDQAGLCMGCHHNSPKSLEPPKCASCHSKTGPGPDGRPGLKGAFHGQCITCHQEMKLESVQATDCIKCHELKK
ncbi:MAG: cytochrome c family protein [Desulfobacterales bacterium]|nr:cytochrome c family protein [Desulfobacterales bacterium]